MSLKVLRKASPISKIAVFGAPKGGAAKRNLQGKAPCMNRAESSKRKSSGRLLRKFFGLQGGLDAGRARFFCGSGRQVQEGSFPARIAMLRNSVKTAAKPFKSTRVLPCMPSANRTCAVLTLPCKATRSSLEAEEALIKPPSVPFPIWCKISAKIPVRALQGQFRAGLARSRCGDPNSRSRTVCKTGSSSSGTCGRNLQ